MDEEEEATTKDVTHLLGQLRRACSESGGKGTLNKAHW